MKRYTALVIMLTVALAFAFSTAGVVNAKEAGSAEMVLKTEAAKKPALFPHAKHQTMEGNTCGTCHHSKDADGKKIAYTEGQKNEKCVTCHNSSMANKKLNSFKKAAHARCKVCHKEKKKAGITTAPTKCTGCHQKGLK